MKKHLALRAGLSISTAAYAEIPMLDFVCPGNLQVHADRGEPVYINGKQAKLKKFNESYFEASRPGTIGWHDADLSFHTSIFDATGNWVLRRLIVTIRAALAAEIRVTGQHAASPKESLQLHRNVFEAICRRQPAGAHAAMTWLLLSTRRDLDAMGRDGVLRPKD